MGEGTEHATPTLEERLKTKADSRCIGTDEHGPYDHCGWCGQDWPDHDEDCEAADAVEALSELARLRAEVERLKEGWEAEVRDAGELREAMNAAGIARQRINGRLVVFPLRDGRLQEIARIIEAVDARCAAADGPVTPTLREMRQEELSRIYELATLTATGGDRA